MDFIFSSSLVMGSNIGAIIGHTGDSYEEISALQLLGDIEFNTT
jgi:hypothetical protein